MARRQLKGRALLGGVLVDGVTLVVDGEHLAEVRIEADAPPDPQALILAPGFVDVHVHGAAGADFMDGEPEAVRRICAAHARHGSTALMATTLSAEPRDLERAVDAARSVIEAPVPGSARVVGVHFEGPWISPQWAGAQEPSVLRAAQAEELEGWLAQLGSASLPVMCTVAPEVEGVLSLIERYGSRVIFAIGHSGADYALGRRALEAGARHFTHLFNAMRGLHHREPGLVGAALESESATAELVADGAHVHPAVLGVASRVLAGRGVLVTDAMRACGMPDGEYSLYRHRVHVSQGVARLPDGTLAGSVLTMDRAVRTVVEGASVELARALSMASEVPARLLGIEGSHGHLAAGRRADVVVMAPRGLEVVAVLSGGREVASREVPWST